MEKQQVTEEQPTFYVIIYIPGVTDTFTSKIEEYRLFNRRLPQAGEVFHHDYWNHEGFNTWCLDRNIERSSQRVCYVEYLNPMTAIIYLEMYEDRL